MQNAKPYSKPGSKNLFAKGKGVVGKYSPITGFPLAIGDYMGKKYNKKITSEVTNKNGILNKIMTGILNLTEVPVSKLETLNKQEK